MRLIVTEKDSAARKIADILGHKVAVREHGRGRLKVRSYHFAYGDDDAVAIGLRGHVMQTVFPNTYRRWSLKYLGDMIEKPDLAWVVDGGAAGTLAALRAAAKGATEVIIATDYDREGELIGHEALEILRGDALKRHPRDKPEKRKAAARGKAGAGGRGKAAAAPPPEPVAEDDGDPRVKPMVPAPVVDRHVRVRYSALTAEEVEAAFNKPSTVDFHLAEAAHSRQDIDLIWGAVLTRFMSLASYRYGSDYLSVGRVAIADSASRGRPRTRAPRLRAGAVLGDQSAARTRRRDARGGPRQGPLRQPRRHANGARPSAGRHRRGRRRRAQPRQVPPPAPFNTTALMSAASAVGVSPARAMRAAESLDLDGLVSYPCTDNTVYPASLDLRGSLQVLASWQPVAGAAARLAKQAQLTPTRGKRRTTDHPPIYPVGVPQEGAEWRPGQGLRFRGAALSGHPAASRDHRGAAGST